MAGGNPLPKPPNPLFTLPIAPLTSTDAPGQLTATLPAPQTYLLTFTSPPDNRLTTPFCTTLLLALDILAHRHAPGVVITTSAIPKFYSNGMDLAHAAFTRAYLPDTLYRLWHRLLTFPWPTLALVNGHAFAGGLMLALMHDYRVMNPHRGYLCLNELHLGAPLRPPMTAVFRMKVPGNGTLRKLILEAHRFKALDALREGLVDGVGGVEECLAFVAEMDLVGKAQPGATGRSVYGELKREMWRETVELLEGWAEEGVREARVRDQVARENLESMRRVEEWERLRSKL